MSAETLATFPLGGVHPREAKELTNKLETEVMPAPAEVRLFLKQHVGAPCTPKVDKKAKVTEGDLVASTERLGAPIHASVTGTVRESRTPSTRWSAVPRRLSS